MDYARYQFKKKDWIRCFLVAFSMTTMGAYILYKQVAGLLLFLLIFPIYVKYYREMQVLNQKRILLMQFKDAMQSVSATLLTGYSLENAWKEAEKEIRDLYGEDAYMYLELKEMNAKIKMSQPVEQVLYEFSIRSTCEEIISFGEILKFAKRSGGDFAKIIRNTTLRISEKQELEQEIETIISGKKMEQKVMNVIPVALLLYLNLTSPDFMEPLYGNAFGVLVMTAAFFAYLGALRLSQKIMMCKL